MWLVDFGVKEAKAGEEIRNKSSVAYWCKINPSIVLLFLFLLGKLM
jgi:hypothetical protein